MQNDSTTLGQVSYFSGLSESERDYLASIITHQKLSAETILFKRGDPGDCMYIIDSGRIDLYMTDRTGDHIALHIAGPGEVFGEISILDGGPRTANARALEDTELLIVTREHLKLFLVRHPHAALDLLSVLGRRLRNTDELLSSRVARNPNAESEVKLSSVQKIASFIADFSGSMPFLILNALFFAVWILINTGVLPIVDPFDAYPFGFLTMAVSLEAIFLSIFVLLAQNVQGAKERVRNDIEYEVNVKAELEVAHLHEKFDDLKIDLLRKIQRLERALKTSD